MLNVNTSYTNYLNTKWIEIIIYVLKIWHNGILRPKLIAILNKKDTTTWFTIKIKQNKVICVRWTDEYKLN